MTINKKRNELIKELSKKYSENTFKNSILLYNNINKEIFNNTEGIKLSKFITKQVIDNKSFLNKLKTNFKDFDLEDLIDIINFKHNKFDNKKRFNVLIEYRVLNEEYNVNHNIKNNNIKTLLIKLI